MQSMNAPSAPEGLVPGGRFDEWTRRPVRYVAADVDGTLLGPDLTVSEGVGSTVLAAVSSGVPVGFATGRMRNGALHIHRSLDVPGPHIFHNGAEVRADGETVAAWPLDDASVDAVVDVSAQLDAYCELYTSEGFVMTRYKPGAEVHWETLDRGPDATVTSRSELGGEAVLKATFIGFEPGQADAIEARFAAIGLQIGSAHAADLDWRFINVTMPGVHKGRAVEAAAAHLGVDSAEVMAIGDGHNDMDMLSMAGTAVAMGQAGEDVKALAHLVAPSVRHDGAAVALERLVLDHLP